MISQWHALTSTSVLHYQVQSLLCLYHLKELDWRWRENSKWIGGGDKVMGQKRERKRRKGGAVENKSLERKGQGRNKREDYYDLAWIHDLETQTCAGSQWVKTEWKLALQCDSPMLGWFNIFMILTSRKSCEKQAIQSAVSNTLLDLGHYCCQCECVCCWELHLYSTCYINWFCKLQFALESIFVMGKTTLMNTNIHFLFMSMWKKQNKHGQWWHTGSVSSNAS